MKTLVEFLGLLVVLILVVARETAVKRIIEYQREAFGIEYDRKTVMVGFVGSTVAVGLLLAWRLIDAALHALAQAR